MNKNIFYACFSHIPITTNYPDFIHPIYLGGAANFGELNLNDLAPTWVPFHPILGSTAGTFALKNYLIKNRKEEEFVGICQYRKFLSFEKIGSMADNYQAMDIVRSTDLDKNTLSKVMLQSELKMLVSKPGQFLLNEKQHNYLYQYKDCHHVEDFLRFTAELLDHNILDKNEIYNFLDEKIFLPGGLELGIYPLDFWLSHIIELEKVVISCINKFPIVREGYQARSWAFCMERIGSFLALAELKKMYGELDWVVKGCGNLNLINDNDSTNYAPGI
jgi:hypothetical protein